MFEGPLPGSMPIVGCCSGRNALAPALRGDLQAVLTRLLGSEHLRALSMGEATAAMTAFASSLRSLRPAPRNFPFPDLYAAASVGAFAAAFNQLVTELSSVVGDEGTSPGDPLIEELLIGLRGLAARLVAGSDIDRPLTGLGFACDTDGRLRLDPLILAAACADDPDRSALLLGRAVARFDDFADLAIASMSSAGRA